MSATIAERTEAAPDAAGRAASTRSRRRRAAIWAGIAAVLLVVAIIILAASRAPDRVELGPADPSPIGSKALVQVLRDRGVTVRSTDSLAATRRAVRDPAATTILVYDADGILGPPQLRRLDGLAARLVLVQPTFEALDALAPGVSARGPGAGTASGCRVGGLRPGDRVTASGERFAAASGIGARACLGGPERGYALVRVTDAAGTEVAVLGNLAALQNRNVLTAANGAYALGLLGRDPRLIWYLPGAADAAALPGDVPLIPPWYAPVMGLLVVVAVAGILWRGRRFGALAIENLPVVVSASETMEGRARLYARGSARLRTVDALRIGAIQRMARDCGLPRVAGVQEVVDAVTAASGRPREVVAQTLLDAVPTGDAELMRLSADLADLERLVHAATKAR